MKKIYLMIGLCLFSVFTNAGGKHASKHSGHTHQKPGADLQLVFPKHVLMSAGQTRHITIEFSSLNVGDEAYIRLITNDNVQLHSGLTEWFFIHDHQPVVLDLEFTTLTNQINQLTFEVTVTNNELNTHRSRILGMAIIPSEILQKNITDHQKVMTLGNNSEKLTKQPAIETIQFH